MTTFFFYLLSRLVLLLSLALFSSSASRDKRRSNIHTTQVKGYPFDIPIILHHWFSLCLPFCSCPIDMWRITWNDEVSQSHTYLPLRLYFSSHSLSRSIVFKGDRMECLQFISSIIIKLDAHICIRELRYKRLDRCVFVFISQTKLVFTNDDVKVQSFEPKSTPIASMESTSGRYVQRQYLRSRNRRADLEEMTGKFAYLFLFFDGKARQTIGGQSKTEKISLELSTDIFVCSLAEWIRFGRRYMIRLQGNSASPIVNRFACITRSAV